MSLILGFDAGGTFTDSVVFDSVSKKVISKGKALTTNHDLSKGIKNSIEISLDRISLNDQKNIKLVVVSSTLATNSVVNSTGCRVGLILVGFDHSILKNSILSEACNNGEIILINGGHDAEGNEKEKLNLAKLKNFVKDYKIESIAIASQFSTRNPEHENKIRDYLRKKTSLPITCSHELSFELNGPKRALTCVLNASLTHIIDNLINDIEKILIEKKIYSKLMVVKGDGSLINTATARFRPIDTTMSGPAASSIGALWLTERKNAFIVDIGGTTTDISLIKSGYPIVSKKGAKIGKWDTMVEALSISTIGLGGDSQVSFSKNPNESLSLGPKRHVPLSIKALEHPIIIETLKKQSNFPINNPTDGLFVWKKKVKRSPGWLSKIEKSSFERLFENKPLPLSDIAPNQASLGAIDRLINYNLVEVSGFTPTDAAHVLGAYDKFSKEASILGAIIITKQKNGSGKFIASSKEELSEIVLKRLFEQSSLAIFDFALNEQFEDQEKKVFLKNKVFQESIFSDNNNLVKFFFKTKIPIVSIGASANLYYPNIAKLLNTKNITPKNFSVAGAVGAAVGSIKQTIKILITKGQDEKYKVHSPSKVESYQSIEKAIKYAKKEAKSIANQKCLLNGAVDLKTKVKVFKKEFQINNNKRIFLECNIIATSYGNII